MLHLPPLSRLQRRRIHKIIHATCDKWHARRLMVILLLHESACSLMFITLPVLLMQFSPQDFGYQRSR